MRVGTLHCENRRLKSVMMVAYVFPPIGGSGVQRTLKFVKYLPSLGWRPTVVTIKPYEWIGMDHSLIHEVPLEADVRRCYSLELRRLPFGAQSLLNSAPIMRLRRLFHVPDHCVGWLPFALLAARNVLRNRRVDVVYTSFPPGTAHLIGYLLKWRYGLPWVADFRDPWTKHPNFKHAVPRLHRGLIHQMEQAVLRCADRIIVATDSMKQEFINANPWLDTNRIVTITNGFDEEDFPPEQPAAVAAPFTVAYTGTLDNLSLSAFFRAVCSLLANGVIERHDLRLRFVGDALSVPTGVKQPAIVQAVARAKLLDVTEFTGYVSHDRSIRALLEADALLAFSWGSSYLPGKTFEYLRARKPILALAKEGDEVGDFVKRSGAGIVVAPDDEAGITEALRQLHLAWRENAAGRWHAEDRFVAQYERRVLTARLAAVFDELVAISGKVQG